MNVNAGFANHWFCDCSLPSTGWINNSYCPYIVEPLSAYQWARLNIKCASYFYVCIYAGIDKNVRYLHPGLWGARMSSNLRLVACDLIIVAWAIHIRQHALCAGHWRSTLEQYTGAVHWHSTLAQYTSTVHWHSTLTQYTGAIHWAVHYLRTRAQYTGKEHLRNTLERYAFRVHWCMKYIEERR